MATTTFEKPMGTEVETLKSQISELDSKLTSLIPIERLEVSATDNLATYTNSFFNGYNCGLILFTCAGSLATDMPSSANVYGNGFINASGYYHSAWYHANNGVLYIGSKRYNQTTWTWKCVTLTAI